MMVLACLQKHTIRSSLVEDREKLTLVRIRQRNLRAGALLLRREVQVERQVLRRIRGPLNL